MIYPAAWVDGIVLQMGLMLMELCSIGVDADGIVLQWGLMLGFLLIALQNLMKFNSLLGSKLVFY